MLCDNATHSTHQQLLPDTKHPSQCPGHKPPLPSGRGGQCLSLSFSQTSAGQCLPACLLRLLPACTTASVVYSQLLQASSRPQASTSMGCDTHAACAGANRGSRTASHARWISEPIVLTGGSSCANTQQVRTCGCRHAQTRLPAGTMPLTLAIDTPQHGTA
jgi:hypothetical protein